MAVDYAHELIDKRIEKLSKRLAKEYRQALKELEAKANEYLQGFKKEDRLMRLKVVHGDITKKEYLKWRQGKMLYNQRYNELIDNLADDLAKTNITASYLVNKTLPESFVDASNFSAFKIEKTVQDVSFSIYNVNAVNRLIANNSLMLPKATVDISKDMLWNRQKVNSAMAQGILQGDSIPKIAKRLRMVTDMNEQASLRNARTLHTAAESLGRMDTLERAESMGIEVMKQWIAVHDGRTRDAHRELDGQMLPKNKRFINSIGAIRWPADELAAPANVYNCRCSLDIVMPKYQTNTDRYSGAEYEAWKKGKKAYTDYLRGKDNA